jgi:hypothetical protein
MLPTMSHLNNHMHMNHLWQQNQQQLLHMCTEGSSVHSGDLHQVGLSVVVHLQTSEARIDGLMSALYTHTLGLDAHLSWSET